MSKLKEIKDGWINHFKDLLGNLDPEIKKEAEKRIAICEECPIRSNFICDPKKKGKAEKNLIYNGVKRTKGLFYKGCGCPIKAKAKSPDSLCPLGKW